MHSPKPTPFLKASLFLLAGALGGSALASESLAGGAGALENALGNLEAVVPGGGMGFGHFGTAKQVGHVRVAAAELKRVAASGATREQAGTVMNQLRTGIEGM